MGEIIINKNSLGFTMRDEILLIEPYLPGCLRVRSTRNGKISDERYTISESPFSSSAHGDSENAAAYEDTNAVKDAVTFGNKGNEKDTAYKTGGGADCAFLETGSLKVEMTKTWSGYCLTFYINGREILKTAEEGDPVLKFHHTEGDNYRVRALFEAKDGEHFYGLGQEQQSCFDRKGGAYELIHYNTKSTVPFVYSSLGYGFLWNNPSPGHCELTNNHTLWQSDSAYQADYFIIAGNPAQVMKSYCDLTGYAPMLPKWAAGFWQCRLRYESQNDLLKVAREYKKRNIPIDAIVIDYFHWTEQGEWEFDPKYWQNPKEMCDELREMNIEPVVSIWPTINPKSKYYKEMNDKNMLVRTENGQYGTFDFYGQQTFIDVTNPKTREFVWDKVKKNYYDKCGIKTFWLDEAEPEVHPQQFGNLKFYAGNGAQTAMLYPYYYVKTFYDGLKAAGETDIVSLTRAAYHGSQKFGAIVWNGDIPSTFKALRQSVISGLSMAMCGIVWWNSDIGGFLWGDTESEYFRELIVRWFQFGVFSPIMRLHGVRKRPSGHVAAHPGIIEPSGGDNEIWSFGERNYHILKDLIVLRERLKPYILKHMEEASKTGAPIMRPMFFDYCDDEICYSLSDQYMFGSDILFAPIMDEGQTERVVYLPKGKWIRTTDKTAYDGGCHITCRAEINEFIAFVKDGSEVINLF